MSYIFCFCFFYTLVYFLIQGYSCWFKKQLCNLGVLVIVFEERESFCAFCCYLNVSVFGVAHLGIFQFQVKLEMGFDYKSFL